MRTPPHIVILAAGKGTRMMSALPKVLFPVLFRPMIHHVLDLAGAIPHASLCLVVGHGEALVRQACRGYGDILYCPQKEQLGTGHAVRMTEPFLGGREGTVLVLCGDVILTRPDSLTAMLQCHEAEAAVCTVGTAVLPEPFGYGRILSSGGRVAGIREEKDCSQEERAIREVNSGIYCFDVKALFTALSLLTNANKQGEYYLTDTVRLLAEGGGRVARFRFYEPEEMAGINDHEALAKTESVLRTRFNRTLMKGGVSLQDPATTYIDTRCRIEAGARIEAGCTLIDSAVSAGVVIEAGSRIASSTLGAGVHVKQGSYIEESIVAQNCTVGPYARLRPKTDLGPGCRIGNFVETKNSVFAAGAKAAHLSYIGDADVGRDVNIGCGFITCNYDGGPVKHRTVIEDEAFIGSDSQAVAPVRIGAGSYVATGTTITDDVPSEALAISRGRQVTKPGYAKKYRKDAKPKP